ncbi:hypothetical protein SLE2022_399310 [Rubroshorea leprosula]
MTMLEKLFVQIFERKKRIIDQVKDQIILFDHHLASKCLIEGFDPPSWLISSSKSGLSREDLISELLLPQQQSAIPCPSTSCSLYQQPVVTAGNLQFPDGLQTGVDVLNEDFDTEILSQCPSDKVGCAPSDKSGLEPSVTSPKDCLGPTISAINADPALSLARIQRSKSRQRALELRSGAKAAKSNSISKSVGACNSQVIGSRVTYSQFGMEEVVLDKAVDRDIRNCAVDKENIGPCQSNENCENVYSGRITRSRSSARLPKSVNGPSIAGNPYIARNDGDTPTESLAKSKQQADVDRLLRLVKPSAISDDSCGMGNAKAGNNESNKKASNADRRRLTRSKSSRQQHECVKELQNLGRCYDKNEEDGIHKTKQQPDRINEIMNMVKSFDNADESCRIKAKMGDCQVQQNIVNKSNGTNAISGNNCAISFNSLTAVDDEVRKWRHVAPNHSPPAKSLNSSQEVARQIVSRSKVNPLPCTVGIDSIDPDKCDATVAETDVDSGKLDEAHSAKSSSKSSSANKPSLVKSSNGFEGAGLEVAVSSPQSVSPMIVKPKQLDFDDMDESRLNQPSSPSWKEEEVKSSERESFTLLCSADRSVEVTSFDDRQNSNFPPEVQLLIEGEGLTKEGKLKRVFEAHKEETCRSGRTSNSKVVSSVKDSSGVYIDRDSSARQESNKISEQNFSLIYHSSHSQVAHENFPRNLRKDALGSKLSNLDTNREIDSPQQRVSEQLEVEKPTELVPVTDHFDTNIFGDHEISVAANFAGVSGPALVKNAGETPTGSAIGHPCTISTYETKGDSEQQKIKSGTCHIQHADFYSMGRCGGDEKDTSIVPVESNSTGNQIPKKSMQPGRSSSFHMEGSSFHKRRKIESQLTSPLKDQGMESNDKDQNAVCGSISSSQSQVDKGKFSLEEKETKAESHLGFIDEGLLSVLCSSKEAPADSQACFLEETGVEDRTSITSGSSRQLEIEENQILLEAEDKLGQGDTEHLICVEGSLLESLSHLGETGAFPNYSIDFQHRQPIELLSADQTRPEFEGFIMQTDNEQALNAGEGISIDKLGLPKTSIEHASFLEQLCRSACFQTPFSTFPTTCKIQKSPSVHQSVPNGLLECMGMENVLPINSDTSQPKVSTSSFGEEVSHALHGKSFSISRSQQIWDSKKPYTSPVGKLWDRSTSYSGSSEKRGSTIPELPCITEENENIDEVADAFDEGNGSEAVTRSKKRKPLTEIKEDPNVPLLISEAELFSSRNSLESVSNDHSVNCTKNSVKQKAAIRKTSKRRDTDRLNENQSIPGGENGTKRASASVCNRFNKSKLSGKESLRKGGPSFLEKESRINNIVTNTSSFVTVLQQRQAAAVVKGKRDVKVKALEAAEAAKRLAEKKENERKMKKEALRLERVRLEQENLRQLDLQRKKKEEERKKKEAEMAARKRQREEEEKLEKERKRKRIEESRKLQREAEEKLRVKKDEKEKIQEQDERVNEMKIPNGQTVKNEKMEKETREECIGKKSETKYRTTEVSTNDSEKISSFLEDYNSKVIREVEEGKRNNNLIANTIQEESYDISPYKGSDDEDEENVPNKKFIPSWTSKNYIASIIASQKNLDAEVVFPPDSFCSIDEVLSPRRHQLRRGLVN